MKDVIQKTEAYLKNKEKKTGIKGLYNTKEVAGIVTGIREEYYPKPKKDKQIPEDAKQEEKFEPFYEGEGKQTIEDVVVDQQTSSETELASSEIVGEKPSKQKRQGKREGVP
jgi:hypothetical protein